MHVKASLSVLLAVKKLKGGKSPEVDGLTSKMLKSGGECLLEWLRKIFNACVLEDKYRMTGKEQLYFQCRPTKVRVTGMNVRIIEE